MARISRDSDRIQNPPRDDENSVRVPAARSSQCVTIRPNEKGDREALLANAPSCVKAMANDGALPKNDVEFSIGVRWLLRNGQEEGLRDLLRASDCSDFLKLDLHGERITVDELNLLARSLEYSSITKLDLSNSKLSEFHADAITKLLGPGSKLVSLNLESNDLGDAGLGAVCRSLKDNKTLQRLNLGNCGLNDSHFIELLNVLSRFKSEDETTPAMNETLSSLCISDNALFIEDPDDHAPNQSQRDTPQGFSIYEQLGDMHGVKWLDVSNTGIMLKYHCIVPLLENFNPALQRLDLPQQVL